MNEIIVIVIFIFWYLGALIISENRSKDQKPGKEWMFFLSMVFSPIVGFILYLSSKRN